MAVWMEYIYKLQVANMTLKWAPLGEEFEVSIEDDGKILAFTNKKETEPKVKVVWPPNVPKLDKISVIFDPTPAEEPDGYETQHTHAAVRISFLDAGAMGFDFLSFESATG